MAITTYIQLTVWNDDCKCRCIIYSYASWLATGGLCTEMLVFNLLYIYAFDFSFQFKMSADAGNSREEVALLLVCNHKEILDLTKKA